MNDQQHDDSPEDDAGAVDELARMLSPLKQLAPSTAGAVKIRAAVANSLAGPTVERALPWWRRSISVPIPVAAVLVLLAFVAAFAGRSSSGSSTKIAPQIVATSEPRVESHSTEVFLCGVGKLSSERFYEVRED